MGARPGRPKPQGSGRKKGVPNSRPRVDSVGMVVKANPIRTAYEAGREYGKATAGTVGYPYVPKEYDAKRNLLCRIAYLKGVGDGRRQGMRKSKENKDGDNQSILGINSGHGDVRAAVPVAAVGQRPHPAIRVSGGGDTSAGGGECEQGSGEEGGDGVGEVVPTA